jgi:hypothetical protein
MVFTLVRVDVAFFIFEGTLPQDGATLETALVGILFALAIAGSNCDDRRYQKYQYH